MDARDRNLATARGEALAAQVLASSALQAVFAIAANKQELLSAINAYVDDTLNISGPARGDSHDELNTQIRETARFHTNQVLDTIARGLRHK